MRIQDSEFLTALQLQEQVTGQRGRINPQQGLAGERLSFQEVLQKKVQTEDNLRFSKHASVRLKQRGIDLTDGQLERLLDGTRRAGQKGIKDSLVIVDELAFIVNIPNSTVVTAMDSKDAVENIFTNIDGAVIM
ncbi:MAG: flagellar protein [bacterium]|nr:flagellar protein [bacterium]MCM1375641.1 flagellar protein [Muribaculum sp.]